jgi:hypothetical protein
MAKCGRRRFRSWVANKRIRRGLGATSTQRLRLQCHRFNALRTFVARLVDNRIHRIRRHLLRWIGTEQLLQRLRESDWSEFAKKQVELLAAEGFDREEAERLFASNHK